MKRIVAGLGILLAGSNGAWADSPAPSATPASAAAPAKASDQKTIKDPAEYAAYVQALNTQDPAARAAAMDAFARKYPASVVHIDALEQAMSGYEETGNQTKLLETSRILLGLQPNNVRALAIVTALEEHEASAGNKDALKALPAHADAGIAAIPNWQKPAGFTGPQYAKLRDQMDAIFESAAGLAAMKNKRWDAARDHLLKAFALNPDDMQTAYWLGACELEALPLDPNGFWHVARAMQLSGGNAAARRRMEEYGKAKYRRYHGDDAGWDAIVEIAANSADVPPDFAKSVKKAPSPSEFAAELAKEHDPATLSVSDWEYILSFRDTSMPNHLAAKKVWNVIEAKQQNGKARLKFAGMKVISAEKGKVEAALAEENQTSGTPDMEISLRDAAAPLPSAGDKITAVGTLSGYSPKPFKFFLKDAELSK